MATHSKLHSLGSDRSSTTWTSPNSPRSGPPIRAASKPLSAPSARSKADEPLTLRSDHIAGAALAAFGFLVLAMSGDLPLGTLAFPGAGMMPKLIAVLLIVFALVVVLRGKESVPLASLSWDDLPHALRVLAVSAAAIFLY